MFDKTKPDTVPYRGIRRIACVIVIGILAVAAATIIGWVVGQAVAVVVLNGHNIPGPQ
jgi:hypothetical protein